MVTNSWDGGGSAIHFSSNPFTIVLYNACKKRNIQIEIEHTIFENNMIHHPDEVYISTVSIESYVNVTFTSCTFSGNQGSAVHALQTDIIFHSNTIFHNNYGLSVGAGLSLFMNSFMYLKPQTKLLFSNNYAGVQYSQTLKLKYQVLYPASFRY